jgi:hypothetical protein
VRGFFLSSFFIEEKDGIFPILVTEKSKKAKKQKRKEEKQGYAYLCIKNMLASLMGECI